MDGNELGEALRRALYVRDLLMLWIGALLMALGIGFVLAYSDLTATGKKSDRIDTFNGRWMPMLPPQIRTENRVGAPHCVITGCRVV